MNRELGRALEAEIPHLRRYARALTRDADHADDLVQDTLERAIAKIHTFQPGSNLRAWLFTILHNGFKSAMRQRQRRGHHADWDDVGASFGCPAVQADALRVRDFKRALARLPQQEKQALLLVGLEDMSYEQAAAVMGVEIGTVKSRVSRARSKLRQLMEGTTQERSVRAPAAVEGAVEADSLSTSELDARTAQLIAAGPIVEREVRRPCL
ncbi:MAG: sigma-70 family RNA polymerase sigma factor [Rhodospirillaceae bacterium]|nr:sigma-70 family RNA polymerase sigma factor [Rhodospirillaceae bacterium]